jgi:hypothetical protein
MIERIIAWCGQLKCGVDLITELLKAPAIEERFGWGRG